MGLVGTGSSSGGASTSIDRGPGVPVDPSKGGDPGQGYYQNLNYPQQGPGGSVVTPQQAAQFSNLQGLTSLYNQATQGVQAEGNLQLGNLANQDILSQMQAALQGQNLQQESGFQQQNIGLSQQQLGVQQGALSRQMALLPQQFGIQQQQYGLQEQEGLEQAQRQYAGVKSAETTSGIMGGAGPATQRANVQQDLQNTLATIGFQRKQSTLSYHEQQAQQQDAQKELDIQGKRLGISSDEVKSRLDNALAQLGISSQISSDQIMAEASKVRQGMSSPLSGLFSDLMTYTGIPLASGS